MTADQWIAAIQIGVTGGAAVVGGLLYRGFQTGKWAQTIDKTKDIEEIHKRLDRAGRETSNLASYVQGIEGRCRLIFVDQKVFEVVERELRTIGQGNRLEIERIWGVVRMRGSSRRRDSEEGT